MFNIKTQSLFTTSNTPVTRSTNFNQNNVSSFTGKLVVPTKQVDPALKTRAGTAKMFMGSANKFSSMDYQS